MQHLISWNAKPLIYLQNLSLCTMHIANAHGARRIAASFNKTISFLQPLRKLTVNEILYFWHFN